MTLTVFQLLDCSYCNFVNCEGSQRDFDFREIFRKLQLKFIFALSVLV